MIRAWERRYGAIAPDRSPTARRLYSDEDVERLILLRQATIAGRRIGEIAHLPSESLATLVRQDAEAAARLPAAATLRRAGRGEEHYLAVCLDAATRLDAAGLESSLHRAAVDLSVTSLFDGVISPLLASLGEQWLRGTLSIAHEHLATSIVRAQLDSMRVALSDPAAVDVLVSTTPMGQHHELGALEVAVLAAAEGWRAAYLGPDLPAREIATAARETGASAIALSVVYPNQDPLLESEFRTLREQLPAETALIVGGSGARHFRSLLQRLGAILPEDTVSLRAELVRLRSAADAR